METKVVPIPESEEDLQENAIQVLHMLNPGNQSLLSFFFGFYRSMIKLHLPLFPTPQLPKNP